MENAGVDYKFVNYEGAKHSFTNPDADMFAEKFGMPLAYNKEADEASWKDMQEFFDKIFSE
jgi:dienelactone hydrolase